jgi:hypothetical protein
VTQREAVYDADNGTCVACGARHRRAAGAWEWSCHHAIKAQVLRRRHVQPARIRDETFCVVLCRRCHERHENRTAPVPLERLPRRVVEAVEGLGLWAVDLLTRYHPPTTVGTT